MADSKDVLWLSVLPDMKNFGNAVVTGAGKETDKAAGSLGSRLSSGFVVGFTKAFAAAGGAAVIGKQLYGIGSTFDEVADTIRVGTGATGDDLDSLVQSAKNVGRQVPAEFSKIGQNVADLNTRLGVSGGDLETLSAQFLELGRITGKDISVDDVSSALNAFSMDAGDMSGALDHLYRVSQATGIGVDELASRVASNAPAVQALGFSFDETASLVGKLDKAGLNSSQMMAGMSRSLVNLAKDGEEPAEAFQRVVGEIQGFIEAGDEAAAIDLAAQVFGTRGAAQFVGAISNGTLAMGDLDEITGMTADTILQAGEDTADFGEKWQIFKNKALLALEPVGSAIFNGLGAAMGWLTDTAFPALERGWSTYVSPVLDKIQDAISYAWENVIQPVLGGLVTLIREHVIPWVVGLWEDAVKPAFESMIDMIGAFWDFISPILEALWRFIRGKLGPVFTWLYEEIVKPVWDGITGTIDSAWRVIQGIFDVITSVLKGDFSGAWTAVRDTIGDVWDTIWRNLKSVWDDHIWPIFKVVGDKLHDWLIAPFETAVDKIRAAWDRVKTWFAEPINWVIRHVINGGVISFINAITGALGLDSLRIPPVREIGAPSAAAIGSVASRAVATAGGSTRVSAYARGGLAEGWALVGEEGPELVNFTDPGRVYTAAQTRAILGDQASGLIPGRSYTGGEAQLAGAALASGDPELLAAAAGDRESEALLPVGGLLGRFTNWVSDAWDGVTSFVATIGGKAIEFVRGRLADAAKLVISPLQGLVRDHMSGVWRDFFIGAGDKLVDWIKGVDKETEELATVGQVFSGIDWASALSGLTGGGSVRPVAGALTSLFGPRWGGTHAGVDWAVPVGTPVRAWRPGVVRGAGWNVLAGRTGIGVLLQHNGMGSYYGHLSRPMVSPGDRVQAGQVIALSGNTGRSTGPHLHFETSRGTNPNAVINPLQFFDDGGYLEPGLTQVANLTGRPEPVFTADQWADLRAAADGRVSAMPTVLEVRDVDGIMLGLMRVEGMRAAEDLYEKTTGWES